MNIYMGVLESKQINNKQQKRLRMNNFSCSSSVAEAPKSNFITNGQMPEWYGNNLLAPFMERALLKIAVCVNLFYQFSSSSAFALVLIRKRLTFHIPIMKIAVLALCLVFLAIGTTSVQAGN
jgi:hypothetical protein